MLILAIAVVATSLFLLMVDYLDDLEQRELDRWREGA